MIILDRAAYKATLRPKNGNAIASNYGRLCAIFGLQVKFIAKLPTPYILIKLKEKDMYYYENMSESGFNLLNLEELDLTDPAVIDAISYKILGNIIKETRIDEIEILKL